MDDSAAPRRLVQPCDLHPSQPSNPELTVAVERWMERKLTTCVACGREIKLARYRIRHEPLLWGGHEWTVFDFEYSDPAIVLHTRFEEGGIHLPCLRSAFPHAVWLGEAEAEFTDKAKVLGDLGSERTS